MEKFIMITENGAFLARYLTTKQVGGKCYRCAYYKYCTRDHWNACSELSGTYLFVKPFTDSTIACVHPSDFDFSKAKVRYKGEVVDKFGLKSLIHDTEFMLRNDAWPLPTDIYWENYTYDELKNILKANVQTLDILLKFSP